MEDQLEAIVAAGVPGTVVVADGPSGRIEAAAGVADLRTGEPLTVDHRFRIGSVTKIFVAGLVLQLVEEGALGLDGDAAPFAEGNHDPPTPEPHERAPGFRRRSRVVLRAVPPRPGVSLAAWPAR